MVRRVCSLQASSPPCLYFELIVAIWHSEEQMGRPKLFNREEVLKKAMPVFWAGGYADTAVQDLEKGDWCE
jgi:hypothetical protein